MKKIILALGIFVLFSGDVHADESLELTGFSVIKNTSAAMKLNFRNEMIFTISKQKFSNQKDAAQFCLVQKSKLDKNFNVLLISMSGATQINRFLRESISFKFVGNNKVLSGIWAWSGKDNNITLMYDGNGTSTSDVSAEQLSNIINVSIPAVCTQALKL